ncbi:MAG: tetratricopeptide repeat protein [Hyphomonadaceae bacterium]
MSDVFSEVEEEVRRERWTRWARKYGPWAIGAVALLLVGVGGWRFYQSHSESQARTHAVDFVQAQKLRQEGKSELAARAFAELSERGPKGYRELAEMERAAALTDAGDLAAAIAVFDRIAEETDNPIVRDTARLRAAYLVADTQDFAAVQARVAPLVEAGGPISYLAQELLGIEAWEAGQFDLARTTFQNLSLAFEAPESVRQRTGYALQVIGPGADAHAGQQNEEAPEAPRGEKQ